MKLVRRYKFPEKQTPAMRHWIYALILFIEKMKEPVKVIFT